MDEVGWEEYAVFAAVLIGSTAIGIYYGCFGSRQKTTKDYLLAGGNMSSIPVALSLLCSMISSIALLGYPVEIYLYGTQYIFVVISYIPLTLSLTYLYVPVYFNLKVSSAYEYIEIRFNSGLRIMASIFSIIHVITLMSIAVYAPSLAIELVTGISSRISTAVICFVCVFYSALGGLKAVLWTDVLQGVIMILSLAVIAGKSAVEIGGIGVIWERLELTGRVKLLNFDTDPRTRHTIWTCVVGGYFVFLPTYAATQIQVQRYLSLPNISRVRRAIVMNFIGLFVVVLLCCLTGMIMVAKFADCDPLMSRAIRQSDQLVPFFAKGTAVDVPGLLGLFVSGITCASMSTLSSGLTALASIITYDFVRKLWPKMSDTKLSFVSKINTLILGTIAYLFIFVVEQMGSVLPAVTALSGLLVGPTLGIFTLGMMFPPSTSKGTLLAVITTICIMGPFTILQNVYRPDLANQIIPRSMDGCSDGNSNVTISTTTIAYSVPQDYKSDWKNKDDPTGIQMLSLSYMWHSAVTCCLSVFFGIVFGLINRRFSKPNSIKRVNPKCISPPLLKFWMKFCPNLIEKVVEPAV